MNAPPSNGAGHRRARADSQPTDRTHPDTPGHETPTPDISGRDAKGRFAKGNKGGPGNPFARQVAGLRQALLDAVTEEDIEAIARELVRQARDGNLAAVKLLLSYTVGRPAEAVDPDTLDLEEWQQYKRGAQAGPELTGMLRAMPVELACDIQRAARPGMADVYRNELLDGLHAMEERDAEARQEAGSAGEGEEVEAGPAATDNGAQTRTTPGQPPESGAGPTAGMGAGLPRGLTEAEWLTGLGLSPPDVGTGDHEQPAPSPNGRNGRGTGGAPSTNGRNGRGGPPGR